EWGLSPKGLPLGQRVIARLRALLEELQAPVGLVLLPDRLRGPAQRVQAAQEPAVRLMLPGNRPVALPAVAAQMVEPAVVARTGEGVGGHSMALGEGILRERGPGGRV